MYACIAPLSKEGDEAVERYRCEGSGELDLLSPPQIRCAIVVDLGTIEHWSSTWA